MSRTLIGVAFLAAPFFLLTLLLSGFGSLSLQRAGSFQTIVLSVFLYPLFEELIFRGVIQAEMLRWSFAGKNFAGVSFANVITSAIFAISHALYFQNLFALSVFFPSLVFGYFFERQGNLKIPVILHGWYNFIALLSAPFW